MLLIKRKGGEPKQALYRFLIQWPAHSMVPSYDPRTKSALGLALWLMPKGLLGLWPAHSLYLKAGRSQIHSSDDEQMGNSSPKLLSLFLYSAHKIHARTMVSSSNSGAAGQSYKTSAETIT